MSRYHTNLATEFYVLSCLHRLGITANLTLGNKKGVDIIVLRDTGEAVTVEVKGVAGKYDWPAGNLSSPYPERHFVALLSYEGQIDNPEMPAPSVWIIPYAKIGCFTREYKTHPNVSRSKVLKSAGEFENAWHLIEGIPPSSIS